MANKKISELESRASLSLSDLMAVGDPSTGYLYKTTISDLKTLTGAGVVSFNGRFGTVNPAEGDYTLTQLGDVIITSATNGDVLKYNGSNWVNTQLYTGTVAQYIDGTGAYQTFPTLLSSDRLVTNVRNTTGATVTKGTVVYLNGSSGTLPLIAKAQANSEATSSGTYGVVQDDIANNANGYVVVIGVLSGLNTSAYNAGDILWLSPTVAGAYTTTKPVAPNNAVYVGIVTRSSTTQGTIEVKIQNGYELDELHNVLITSVANNDVLVYETSSSLWKNKAFSTLSTDTLDTVTTRGATTTNGITVGSVTAAGLSNLLGQIRTFVTTGNTYIGANPASATDAGFKLDVNGTTRLNGAASVTGVLTGSDTIRSTNGTVTASISYGSTAGIIGTTSNHSLELRTNNVYRIGVSTAGVVNIANLTGTGSRIVVADAAGNLSASSALTGYVTLDTAQTITGEKIFSTAIGAVGGISLRDTVGGSNYGGIIANSAFFQISAQGGSAILIKSSDGTNALTIGTTGNTLMTNVTATSFIRSGGTSSQFLKADGSVDSNTYATTSSLSSYLPLSGGTLTGALNGTSASFSGIVGVGGATEVGWSLKSNGNLKVENSNGTTVLQVNDTSTGGKTWSLISAGAGNAHSIPAGTFYLRNSSDSITAFQIASTGAATFSSSVTAGGALNLESNESYINLFSTFSVGMNARARMRAVGAGGGSGYGGDLRFSTRTSSNIWNEDAMVITSNGSVGIGTTNPSQLLQVSGNEIYSSKINAVGTVYGGGSFLNAFTSAGGNDVGFAGFIASQNNNSTNRLWIGVHTPSGSNQAFIGTPDSTPIAFWTNATERMRITSGGLLGLNTSNPTRSFQITRTSTAFINAEGSIVAFGSPDTELRLFGNNVETMTLKSGNVGIGTTAPREIQHNVITSSGSGLLLNNSTGGAGASVSLDFNTYSTTLSGFSNYGASIRAIDDANYSAHLTFWSKGGAVGAAQSERMRIESGGNILVGGTNGGALSGTRGMIINGGTIADVQFRLQNNNTGSTGSDGVLLSLAADNDSYLWNYENANLRFGTNNTLRLTITSSGNFELNTGSIKTGEPDTGWGRAAIKIGASVSGAAFNVTRYLPVSVDGTIYYINLNSSTP